MWKVFGQVGPRSQHFQGLTRWAVELQASSVFTLPPCSRRIWRSREPGPHVEIRRADEGLGLKTPAEHVHMLERFTKETLG